MTNDEKIRVQILDVMAKKGLRQASLAREIGVTPQSLHQVIKGERAMLPTSLTAILEALDVELTVQAKDADLLEEATTSKPKKKTWRDLAGAFDDPTSPDDMAENHDHYLGEADSEDYDRMTLQGER